MNKRIEELSEKAVEEMDQEAFNEDMYIPNEYLEKFAELIIRECADLFEIEWGDFNVSGNEASRAVKDHFGVE